MIALAWGCSAGTEGLGHDASASGDAGAATIDGSIESADASPGPAQQARAFCEEMIELMAQRLGECRGPSAEYFRRFYAHTRTGVECLIDEDDVAQGRLTYHDDRALACRAWLETASCPDLQRGRFRDGPFLPAIGRGPTPDACKGVLAPALGEGELGCQDSDECTTGLCDNHGTCTHACLTPEKLTDPSSACDDEYHLCPDDFLCVAGFEERSGVCHRRGKAGEPCAPLTMGPFGDAPCVYGTACDAVTQLCVAAQEGARCDYDDVGSYTACEAIGLICVADPASGVGRCIQPLRSGEVCDGGLVGECGYGARCSRGTQVRVCVPLGLPGDVCDSRAPCHASLTCDSVCLPEQTALYRPPGQGCSEDAQCASDICEGGVCASYPVPRPEGSSCDHRTECRSFICQEGVCVPFLDAC